MNNTMQPEALRLADELGRMHDQLDPVDDWRRTLGAARDLLRGLNATEGRVSQPASQALQRVHIELRGGSLCTEAAPDGQWVDADDVAKLETERDAAIAARIDAQLRQEALTAEIVRLEPIRQRAQEIERLTAEMAALRAQEPAAFAVPQARVAWDGSWEPGDDYLVFAEEASDYDRRVGHPLYAAPVPRAKQTKIERLEAERDAHNEHANKFREAAMRLEAERDALRAALKYVQDFERNRGGCWSELREIVDEALLRNGSKT